MSKEDFGVNFLSDQRYYHFIFAQVDESFTLAEYWKRVGAMRTNSLLRDTKTASYEIALRKVKSKRLFARGLLANCVSERGDGQPPYFYDLAAVKLTLRKSSYLAVGFPFLGLAEELLAEAFKDRKFLGAGVALGTDVPKLIGIAENSIPHHKSLISRIINVEFNVSEDTSLSAVRLGGESPLSAKIYTDFIRENVHKKNATPVSCVLACENQSDKISDLSPDDVIRTRIHLESNGYCKYYAQTSCRNFSLIPLVLDQLVSLGCLKRTYAMSLPTSKQSDN